MKDLIASPAFLVAGLLLMTNVHAAEFNQVLNNKSSINFGYKQVGVPLEGKFKKFAAQINFDPANPDAAIAKFDIDMASIDTGSDEGNDEVGDKEWFNAKAYPTAKFVSTAVKPLGSNKYEVQGKLTIKGKTLPVSAPFTYKADAAYATFDGVFAIKRLDYAIGEGEWTDLGTIANDIQIKFHITAGSKK